MKKFNILVALSIFIGLSNLSNGQTVFQENFNAGIPGTWTITDHLGDNQTWFGTTGGYAGGGTNFLDGTEFVMVDSDADGNGIEMIEDLTSPLFDGTGHTTLLLEFDQYYRNLNGLDTGRLDV